jgi:hypothetical protein
VSSFWDRSDEERRRVKEAHHLLAERQMRLWGWSDQRLLDKFGHLLNPKPGKRGQREANGVR